MTTILACDVLPDMVIRTAFDPGHSSGATAVATFRVTYVDEFDGAVCIHADSRSSRIFEIPDYAQVQVLQWPTYAHEAVATDPEVVESRREDQEYLTPEQVRKIFRPCIGPFADGEADEAPDVSAYFKPGGVTMARWSTSDQVEAAVERVLRRQQSKGQHPSSGAA